MQHESCDYEVILFSVIQHTFNLKLRVAGITPYTTGHDVRNAVVCKLLWRVWAVYYSYKLALVVTYNISPL